MTDHPTIERIRHEIRRRSLSVLEAGHLTPHMIRLTLGGPELEGFHSAGFDDHVKLFVPVPGGETVMRDYTPRRHEGDHLVIDVVDHPGGPVADWARGLRPGDRVEIGGPRGSKVIGGPIAAWLLIGDETALPAIGRRIEESPADTPVTALIAVPGPADEQALTGAAPLDLRWVHRPADAGADPAPLLAALEGVDPAPGTFVWIAAEAGVTRALRAALEARGVPKTWIAASGYWQQGMADGSVKEI
ncbi:siderophore-interacting protein [Falsirhodobacter algicola]|uniref:SIP domain-containing protein n=1 Tax=Falsirhodobacter algicola TaxID=2692330 RepID=A0A8J8SM20_9RHOB|nr:siderophore-interacting protein [Falsirhodobacter algicola]QUS37062.1 SIP domain-containing protein [Falsirhodobacter algicola]